MPWRCGRIRTWLLGLALMVAAGTPLALGQQIHRNRFEGHTPVWIKGGADLAYDEVAHTLSDQTSHDGQRSEFIDINVKQQGSHVHYQYSTGKAPIADDLCISLWVKGNRPGMQLMARVVLPNERDPSSLDQCLTTLIRGEAYRTAGRWQRLDIGKAVVLARQQQQLMQAQLKRQINFDGAYVDTIVLNVYGGLGSNQVWIDDLEIGPVADTAPAPRQPDDPVRPGRLAPEVEFKGTNLYVANKRFFFVGVRLTDTPPAALRNVGFNTLFVDHGIEAATLKEAADLGFWLVPSLPATADATHLTSAENVNQDVRSFPERDAVLFWNLGTSLASEQTAEVARHAKLVRLADRRRPLGADAWDGLGRYSNNLNLVSVHRWPLMTALEMSQYREWLEQRGRLTNPGTFLWTWIQTQTPEWQAQLLYDQPGHQAFNAPVGPHPEQIRLLTYTALGTGCRGLGFWSDRFLADSHQGRDRLLCVAQLVQEIEMLEPLLVNTDSTQWINTSSKDVKAAVLRTSKGILVLPVWQGGGAQYVPGQSAVAKLSIVVPLVPQSHQAWEVTPGEVRALRVERVPGGTKITLPEFGLTGAIVFTSDLQLVVQLQDQCRAKQRFASQYSYDMAVLEMEKVRLIQDALDKSGQAVPDASALLADAHKRLSDAKRDWDARLFADSYRESQRALRPLLLLMRAQWEKAVKELDSPVSSPYAVSYFTLPRHRQFMDEIGRLRVGLNALPGGDFETNQEMSRLSWTPQDTTLDEVFLTASRVSEVIGAKGPNAEQRPSIRPQEGRQCLKLEIKPKHKDLPAPKSLERAFLAINTPTVTLPPGSLVRVSGWVTIPEPITASPDGALLFDSAGGEPLALRLRGPFPWKQFTLYRRVPASGTINVTVALTGLGAAYFDDLRIEPLVGGGP